MGLTQSYWPTGLLVALVLTACGASAEKKSLENQVLTWQGPPPRVNVQFKDVPSGDPIKDTDHELKYAKTCRESLGKYGYILSTDSPIHVLVQLAQDPSPHRLVIASATRGVVADEPLDRSGIKRLCALATQRGLSALQAEGTPAAAPAAAPAAVPPAGPTFEPAVSVEVGDGCMKDTDCKGTRVCESGKCVAAAKP